MIRKFYYLFLFVFLLSSCNEEDKTSYEESNYQCLIVNQGNYNDSNGSLSIQKEDGSFENQVYKAANGWSLASTIESVLPFNDKWVLLCSNEDKIEVVNKTSFKTQGIVKGISIPRYGAISGNFLYATSVTNWENSSNGYVYKINLDSYSIENKIDVTGHPEGIILKNGYVYVASGNKVVVINPETDIIENEISYEKQQFECKHFAIDINNNLWVSITSYSNGCGIAKIDELQQTLTSYTSLENMCYEGHLDLSPDKNFIYYLTATEIIGAQNAEAETIIKRYNTQTGEIESVINGTGFYGFNINPSNGDIYTANVNGFITNSIMHIYDSEGNETSHDEMVGVGACRFLF